jgi:hypothetical protein
VGRKNHRMLPLEGLCGVLRLAAIPREALLRCAATTLSGFHMFFDIACGGGHATLLLVCGSVAVAVCPRACDTSPLASVGTVSPLSVLAAFFRVLIIASATVGYSTVVRL